MAATGLACRACGQHYPLEPLFVCEECFGPLEVQYDHGGATGPELREEIARGPASMWRYQPFLPVSRVPEWDLSPGYTPLVRAERLGRALGLRNLYLKNDTRNPTWSFKDRVVAVAAAAARRFGFDVLSCASTGNLANAVAAHAAKAGLRAVVFIPTELEREKVLTTAVYRPTLVEVEGTYDDVNRLCLEIGEEHRWAIANVNLRPYYSEGAKTLAFEVAEQLGWRAPDHVVVPVGSGNMFVKIHKGFEEFQRLGVIPPSGIRMSAAQPEGCSPIAAAYRAGAEAVAPVVPRTLAKSLAIGNPADGAYVLDIVRRTLAASGQIAPDEVIVAYITGIGLKALEAVDDGTAQVVRIKPTLSSFEERVLARTT